MAQVAEALPGELQRLAQCQNDSAWLAWAGWGLNQMRRYADAAEYLERSLLLSPEDPIVQAEYAIALAGSGDGLASLRLMQELLNNPQLPGTLRSGLQQQVARWGVPAGVDEWRTRLRFSSKLGYDSNLLGAPNLTQLNLTLDGISVPLPLDGSYVSQAGNYLRTDWVWHANRGPWAISAAAALRASSQSGAGQQQLQGNFEYQGHNYYAGGSLAQLYTRIGTRYQVVGVNGGLAWSMQGGACRTRLGLEWQQRTLRSNDLLSGDYGGAALQQTCEVPVPPGRPLANGQLQAWQSTLRWGVDRPAQAQRAGGQQRQLQWQWVALGRGWGRNHQWLLDGEFYFQQDAQGYSPLLQDGARRRMARMAWRAEYSWPLFAQAADGWQLALGVEWQRQRASLPLFGLRSRGTYVVLRNQW